MIRAATEISLFAAASGDYLERIVLAFLGGLIGLLFSSLRLELKVSMVEMEWPGSLDEYSKLINRVNTPRFVFFQSLAISLSHSGNRCQSFVYWCSASVIA